MRSETSILSLLNAQHHKSQNFLNFFQKNTCQTRFLMIIYYLSLSKNHGRQQKLRLRGQAVKTSPFHGGNTGSIPVGVIWRRSQVVRHWSATPVSTGSNPVDASIFPETDGFRDFSFSKLFQERILLRQDSPPAAGRSSDIIPLRRSAILPGGLFTLQENSTKFPVK